MNTHTEVSKLKDSIRLVAFDVDGVLTDGSIIYDSQGKEELKHFNAKDGYGIKELHKRGFITAIITGRASEMVSKRAQELNITHVFQGVEDKLVVFKDLCKKLHISPHEVAYMGDDLPDLSVLQVVGISACPNDAVEAIRQQCKFVTQKNGGCGAARELCDLLLNS